MTVREEVVSGRLAELLQQVQAGNEVVLTKNNEPIAKLVATIRDAVPSVPFKVRTFKGHKVLTPNFSHAEIADEMFGDR